jgi:hypothetical protein
VNLVPVSRKTRGKMARSGSQLPGDWARSLYLAASSISPAPKRSPFSNDAGITAVSCRFLAAP